MTEDITSFKKPPYQWLSNMYPCRLEALNRTWSCAESLYQAMKFTEEETRDLFASLSGYSAKALARTLAEDVRPDWEDVSLNTMTFVLAKKFPCHEGVARLPGYIGQELTRKLLETGDARLVEGNYWHDNFWGACQCVKCKDIVHHNHLGRLLMERRAALQRNA